MTNRVGQQLGNYCLDSQIGQGGFADVYLGKHIYLKTKAAIKILNTQLTQQDQESFLKEAQIIAQLVHPNIVRVLEFGIDSYGNIPYLVMDYAPNGTLRKKHPPQTSLDPNTILPYVQQLAAALQYVHDENHIHLDIKPENMLIDRRGDILLSDFGIAIAAQHKPLQVVEGTVDYMAPEQIRRNPCAASDQYSLAIVVYEWLCGSCPFDGNDAKQIAAQHLTMPPPPLQQIVASVSPEIEAVVLKALAKKPQDRYASILEFAEAFEQACKGIQSPIVNSPQPQPSHLQASAATSLSGQPGGQVLATIPPVISIPGTTPLKPPVVMPGGNQPISPTTRPLKASPMPVKGGSIHANAPLMIRKKPGETIYIAKDHTHYVQAVAWSPNALCIATGSADQEIRIRDASSGNSIVVYKNHTNEVSSVTWSSHSTVIASGSVDQLVYVWEASTGTLQRIYSGHANSTAWGQALIVAWAPKGPCIASAGADRTVQIWDADSGATLFTYRGHKDAVNAVAWSVDGQRIASASDDKTVQVWQVTQGTLLCTYTKHTRFVNAVAWSPDGKRIASGGNDTTVHVWDASTGDRGQILIYRGHVKAIHAVVWSPDGRRIASGSSDKTIRVWDADTGQLLLTYEGHSDRVNALSWSPDSIYIASVSDDQSLQVWQAQ